MYTALAIVCAVFAVINAAIAFLLSDIVDELRGIKKVLKKGVKTHDKTIAG